MWWGITSSFPWDLNSQCQEDWHKTLPCDLGLGEVVINPLVFGELEGSWEGLGVSRGILGGLGGSWKIFWGWAPLTRAAQSPLPPSSVSSSQRGGWCRYCKTRFHINGDHSSTNICTALPSQYLQLFWLTNTESKTSRPVSPMFVKKTIKRVKNGLKLPPKITTWLFVTTWLCFATCVFNTTWLCCWTPRNQKEWMQAIGLFLATHHQQINTTSTKIHKYR